MGSLNWHELLFDFVTLWVTIDPIGTVPLYLSVTRDLTEQQRRRTALRGTLIAFCILAAFLFLGQWLLELMHIQLLSFQIAGGIVLFLFALTMMFGEPNGHSKTEKDGERDVAVFPLALPSIATPGAILSVVVLTDNNTHSMVEQVSTCVVMGVVLAITLGLMWIGNLIMRLIGQAGANVLTRVIGLVLAAVAVQMVYSAFHGELGPG